MTATVQLNPRQALSFDAIDGGDNITRGALLTIEQTGNGPVASCAVIPVASIGAVIASLQLIERQLKGGCTGDCQQGRACTCRGKP